MPCDLYDHSGLERAVARLETKVDMVVASVPEFQGRLRTVETRQARTLGGLAVAGTILGGFAAWAAKYLHLGV